jgi:hypothetical protein
LFWISSIFFNLCSSILSALSSALSIIQSAFFLASANISSSVSFTLAILALYCLAFSVSVFLYQKNPPAAHIANAATQIIIVQIIIYLFKLLKKQKFSQ